MPETRQGQGVAAQVALARRESPHRGQRHVGLARVLRVELPHTFAAFRAGRITEFNAVIIARETVCLARDDRRRVDARLAADPDHLEQLGERQLGAEAARLVYQLDAASWVERRRRAEQERRVTLRPAPDVMSQLSALLPVKAGVAVLATLTREADRLRAAGDARSSGQIMADTLVHRVLGTTAARAHDPAVMINLVVSDDVLWGRREGTAEIDGYGPVPGDLARELAASDHAWLRRLYAAPGSGALVAMDSRARHVPHGLGQLVRLRDRTCRTPWCDAQVRHGDHVRAVAECGDTIEPTVQGLCEGCNYAKQAWGWSVRPRPGPRHTSRITTATGHCYDSTAPPVIAPRYVRAGPGRWTLAA